MWPEFEQIGERSPICLGSGGCFGQVWAARLASCDVPDCPNTIYAAQVLPNTTCAAHSVQISYNLCCPDCQIQSMLPRLPNTICATQTVQIQSMLTRLSKHSLWSLCCLGANLTAQHKNVPAQAAHALTMPCYFCEYSVIFMICAQFKHP